MLSELVIAVTLFLNAGAVLNFKLQKREEEFGGFVDEGSKSAGDKVREFLDKFRSLRIFIALWNILVMFLMLVYPLTFPQT